MSETLPQAGKRWLAACEGERIAQDGEAWNEEGMA